MNVFKLLLSLFITLAVFADTELELAKKYFTEAEIEESLMWVFHLDYGGNRGKFPGYKTEPMKFYKNKELTGEVFAEIDDKGLKVGDKYTCSFSKYSDDFEVLAQKYKKADEAIPNSRYFTEEYYSVKNQKYGSGIDWIAAARKTCDEFPVLIWGDPESINLNLKLRIFDRKIGRLKMRGQDVYFDASHWIKNFMHTPDTDTILRRDLTPKEYEDFVKLIHELRAVIEKGSLEDIYNFVYERSDKGKGYRNMWGEEKFEKYYKVRWHEKYFGLKTREDFLKIKFNEKLKRELIESTLYKFHKVSNGEVSRDSESKRIDLAETKHIMVFVLEKSSVWISRFVVAQEIRKKP